MAYPVKRIYPMELEFAGPYSMRYRYTPERAISFYHALRKKAMECVIVSYHFSDVTKVSDLEELLYDLQADHCLLLMTYDCFHNDDAGDYNKDSLELLTWNQLQLLCQHIKDLWWFYRRLCAHGFSSFVLSSSCEDDLRVTEKA